MRYPEYKAVNYAEIADEILDFWKENEIFEKSIEVREGHPVFNFYEGPPCQRHAGYSPRNGPYNQRYFL